MVQGQIRDDITQNDSANQVTPRDSQLSSLAQLSSGEGRTAVATAGYQTRGTETNQGEFVMHPAFQDSLASQLGLMSNNELTDTAAGGSGSSDLSQIGNNLSTLGNEFQSIGSAFQSVGQDLTAIGTDINTLKQDFSQMGTDIRTLLNNLGDYANLGTSSSGNAGSDQTSTSGTGATDIPQQPNGGAGSTTTGGVSMETGAGSGSTSGSSGTSLESGSSGSSAAGSSGSPLESDSSGSSATGSSGSSLESGSSGSSAADSGGSPLESGSSGSSATGSSGSSLESGTSATSASGQFTVQGDQIIGPNGKPFIAVGLNDTTETMHNMYTGELSQLAADGANTIRIMGDASDIENPNSALNQEVQAANNAGMVAIISYTPDANAYGGTGEIISGSDLTEAETAMSTAAQMYKNNPDVWFNTINESGSNGDATNPAWLQEQEGIMSAIRSTGNTNPIVVDDTAYGGGGLFGDGNSNDGLYENAQALESYGNVIGDVHDYQGGNVVANTEQGIQAIESQGMPVIIGEYGTVTNSFANDPSILGVEQAAEQLNVGRLVWPEIGASTADVTAQPGFSTIEADWQQGDQANA